MPHLTLSKLIRREGISRPVAWTVIALILCAAISTATASASWRNRGTPTTPSALTLTSSTSDSIGLSWTASHDNVAVTGYNVFVGRFKVGSTANTSYVFSGLSCGTTYTLGVQAYDGAGNRSGTAKVSTATAACAPGPPLPAPVDTAPPTVSGSALVGSALKASTGSWSGNPTDYSYQWRRCDSSGNGCGDITGASTSSYTPGSSDQGDTVRVTVTASNGGGAGTATSAQTLPVAGDSGGSSDTPSWVGDYDTGGLGQWLHPGINSNLWDNFKTQSDFTAVTSPLRQGTYAGKFVVHPGDCPFNCPSQERSEAYLDPATTGGLEGHEEWYAWSSYFPNTDPTIGDATTDTSLGSTNPFPNAENIFTQWHGLYPYEANVGLGVNKIPNSSSYHVQLFVNGGDSNNPSEAGSIHLPIPSGMTGYVAPDNTYINLLDMTHEWNKWLDFRVHVYWSVDPSKGFIEVEINDGSGWQTALPLSHTATLYNYSGGNEAFMKQGWYRMNAKGSTAVSTVYDDGTRIGPTEASVSY
jgi:chitodextrinase